MPTTSWSSTWSARPSRAGSRRTGALGSSSSSPGTTAVDSVAFATALIDCAGTEADGPVAFTLRLTVGLEKRDGRWLVTHEHHSEPLPYSAPTQT
jgi:hypothetical protein